MSVECDSIMGKAEDITGQIKELIDKYPCLRSKQRATEKDMDKHSKPWCREVAAWTKAVCEHVVTAVQQPCNRYLGIPH